MGLKPILTNPSTAIIIATAPTGLGHLRVTDALYHGLPKGSSPVLLGAKADAESALYRFISIHPLTRRFMEFSQNPPFEKIVTKVGTFIMHKRTKNIYRQIKTILGGRFVVPKTIVLVAAHAIQGHQIAAIKETLEKEMNAKVFLAIQITDDSPQTVWYVDGADVIFAPSEYTKTHLVSFAKKDELKEVPIEVTAYPVSPLLAENLTDHAFENKVSQTDPESSSKIHMTIPVPGAAVGTSFMSDFIKSLNKHSPRFLFHVVSRKAPFTESFLNLMYDLEYVQVKASYHDRETVASYEEIFKDEIISLELTKPSEQSFKALIDPRKRGGCIILFSNPVGRQEYDNLNFLKNHNLMPRSADSKLLWKMSSENQPLTDEVLIKKSHNWRALLLPDDPNKASSFTLWCLREKLFSNMMTYSQKTESIELKSTGVEQFWKKIEEYLSNPTI